MNNVIDVMDVMLASQPKAPFVGKAYRLKKKKGMDAVYTYMWITAKA